MAFERTQAQRAVIENRAGTLLVSAAAGSGKTSVLVERLLTRVVEEEIHIDSFLIITFTKAAAEELRIRISRALAERLRADPQNRHLRRQSVLLYHTQISTIHALGTKILREWGHALDLPIDFSLCEEEDASILMQQALTELLDERYEDLTPDSHFTSLLDLLSSGRDDSRLVDIVLDMYARMQSHADPLAWMETQRLQWALDEVSDIGQTIWGEVLLADTRQSCAHWMDALSRALICLQEDSTLLPYADSISETRSAIALLQDALHNGWDAAHHALPIPFPRLKAVRNPENPHLQAQVKQIRSQCKDEMEALAARFAEPSETLLCDMRLLYPAMLSLLDLLRDFFARYSALKLRRSVLDFADLEHKTLSLLVDAKGAPSEIATTIAARYTEIMVDEYQDTNQVQNMIFTALSQRAENLFLVGDVKQSIYRFRLADPTIFLEKYCRYLPYEEATQGQARKILLSQNFRSRPTVLDACNYLFSNIMSEDLGEMVYGAQEALYASGSFPPSEDCATELHVLNLEGDEEDGARAPSKQALEARFVAAEITRLLKKPFLVTEGEAQRPLVPDDIVILLRSPGSVRHHYIKALRDAQIPWVSEGEGGFFETTEIAVMLSYLQVIDNPHQDIPLLSLLHSPLLAFDAEAMANIRQAQEGDLFEAIQAAARAGDSACQGFVAALSTLRFEAVDMSCHALLWLLYERSCALEIFERMPGGAARRENLLRLHELSCHFEHAGHRGLFGFLRHIKKLREGGRGIASGAASESSGVRILSIHRSKGLEFPLVFLCGLGKRFNYGDMQKPMLFHSKLGMGPRGVDRERMLEFVTLPRIAVALQLKREMLAEEMRLLYVAMTRAKDKLIMTHSLSFGEGDLKKLGTSLSTPLAAKRLEGCSSAGQWILLTAMTRTEGEVLRRLAEADMPDQQIAQGSAWKIAYHTGTLAPSAGLDADALRAQVPALAPVSDETIWEKLHWAYPQQALAAIPVKVTASALLKEETYTRAAPSFRRPRFVSEQKGLTAAQKGSALHTVMQNIQLSETETSEQIANEIARLVVQQFITQQEADAVSPAAVHQFFTSPDGQAMRSASAIHREFPFSILVPAARYYENMPQDEQLLLQGVVDCWLENADGIHIIDFKTNRIAEAQVPEAAEAYRTQMDSYALALETLTGKPVVRKSLWFLAPGCAALL